LTNPKRGFFLVLYSSICKTIKLQYDHFPDILPIIAAESHGMELNVLSCFYTRAGRCGEVNLVGEQVVESGTV